MASIRSCFFLFAMSAFCACALAMPTVESRDDLGQPRREQTPSRSWSGVLRGPKRTSVPSRFDTQLVDLNRNPTYYNYHMLPEDTLTDFVRVPRSRQRRSPQRFGGFGSGFRNVDAGFPSDDILRPPRFRDEQPRQPERTLFSDFSRTGCIDGGPSCTPKPQRKYFDFYS